MYMKITVIAIAIAAAVASTTSVKANDFPNQNVSASDSVGAGEAVDIESFLFGARVAWLVSGLDAVFPDNLVIFDYVSGDRVGEVPTVDQADRLVVADIDCDGNDDVVVLGRTGQIGVQFLGEIAEPIGDMVLVDDISTDDLVVSDLAVADFNDDGKPDIIVTGLGVQSGKVESKTYTNDRSGGFGEPMSQALSTTSVNPLGLPIIECLDNSNATPGVQCGVTTDTGDAGDGDSGCEGLVCQYDTGNSAWGCNVELEVTDCEAGGNTDLTSSDSNGSGMNDTFTTLNYVPSGVIQITDFSSNSSLNSTRGFNPPTSTVLDIPAADVTAIEAGDADGDGTDDIRLLTVNGVIFLTRQSDGTFAVADEVGLPATANASALLTFEEEETGETSTLLASALSINNTISFTLRLSGDGESVNFVGEVIIDPGDDAEAGDSGAVATGDIDQDGNPEIARFRVNLDTLEEELVSSEAAPSGQTGEFELDEGEPETVWSVTFPDPLALDFEDLDIPDATAGVRGPAGPFDRVILAATAEDTATGDDFILFTFDDDGTLDGFAPATTLSFFRAIGVGDVDADGRDDLAVMGRRLGLRIFLNNNDGSFVEAAVDGGDFDASGFPNVSDIRIADLVGDATPEVFFSGIGNTPAPGIVQHDGDGTFSLVQRVGDGNDFDQFVRGIATGDVNGDGRVDAVYTVEADTADGASEMRVFLNNGGGFGATFTAFDAGPDPLAIELADADGDGDLDALVTNTATTTAEPRSVSLLRNDGGANFAAPVQFGTRANPVSLATADLDGVNGHELIIGSADDFSHGFPEGVSILTNLPGQIIFLDGFEDVPNSP